LPVGYCPDSELFSDVVSIVDETYYYSNSLAINKLNIVENDIVKNKGSKLKKFLDKHLVWRINQVYRKKN